MTNREENIKKINGELEQVADGTFFSSNNRYPEEVYNLVGIRTNYNMWKRDEFFAKSETTGKEISLAATDYVLDIMKERHEKYLAEQNQEFGNIALA